MTKYIDADRLKAEIERKIHEISHPLKDGYEVQSIGKIEGLSELLEIIDSLQQEQPIPRWVHANYSDKPEIRYTPSGIPYLQNGTYMIWLSDLDTLPKDGTDLTNPIQEQPEVDLKKEIKEWTDLMVGASFPEQDGDFISEEDYRSAIRQTAIHFLGFNARKEEK